MKRRAFLVGAALVACACKTREERCASCGMKIDRASPWRAEIVWAGGEVAQFDTPRCALRAWVARGAARDGRLRVQEYYDRSFRDATDVRFVAGGDVTGPMGPDLVPVAPSQVTKFIQDHGADRAYTLAEITSEVLNAK